MDRLQRLYTYIMVKLEELRRMVRVLVEDEDRARVEYEDARLLREALEEALRARVGKGEPRE